MTERALIGAAEADRVGVDKVVGGLQLNVKRAVVGRDCERSHRVTSRHCHGVAERAVRDCRLVGLRPVGDIKGRAAVGDRHLGRVEARLAGEGGKDLEVR